MYVHLFVRERQSKSGKEKEIKDLREKTQMIVQKEKRKDYQCSARIYIEIRVQDDVYFQ